MEYVKEGKPIEPKIRKEGGAEVANMYQVVPEK